MGIEIGDEGTRLIPTSEYLGWGLGAGIRNGDATCGGRARE